MLWISLLIIINTSFSFYYRVRFLIVWSAIYLNPLSVSHIKYLYLHVRLQLHCFLNAVLLTFLQNADKTLLCVLISTVLAVTWPRCVFYCSKVTWSSFICQSDIFCVNSPFSACHYFDLNIFDSACFYLFLSLPLIWFRLFRYMFLFIPCTDIRF